MSRGLLPGRLADSMLKNPPTSVAQMLEKAQKYIKLEEFKQVPTEDKRDKSDVSGKRQRATDRYPQQQKKEDTPQSNLGLSEPIDKIFQEIKGKITLKYPAPMRTPMEQRDKTRFCEFHNEVGHRTDECKHLTWELKNQIRSGKLKEYLTDQPKEKVARIEEQRYKQTSETEGHTPNTIFVIHAETVSSGLSNAERKRKLHELYSLFAHPPKREPSNVPSIFFDDLDLNGIKYPHDDALVVSVNIGEFLVKRVLIDNGSSANVLFSDAYHKMEPLRQLQSTNSIMTNFTGDVSTPMGKLELQVAIGEGVVQKTSKAIFFVVKAASPYNAILGRSWLHDIKAIPSTYHQCVKYPVNGTIGTLVGDHIASRECHAAALKKKD